MTPRRPAFERVLLVCAGNVCRSPLAQVLLTGRPRGGGSRAEVDSAGLAAPVGRPADPIAVELARERGLDLSGHRARQLTPGLVQGFELLLVMEQAQERAVEGLAPTARGRVHRLGRFGGFDVPDPYRRPRAAFEEALALIERGLDDFERAFWAG
jgi:low molecular weight protein-tyrosine phosphatase